MAKATATKKTKITNAAAPEPLPVKKEQPWYFQYLINAWVFIPVLVYFNTVNKYALNLPIGDDYHAVLKFLNEFKVAQWGDKIGLLFQQHNEHRIFSSRLIFLIYNTFAGGGKLY